MPGPDSPDRHRRAPRALAAMVGLLVVAAGCSTTDDRTGTDGTGTASSVPPAASTPSATGVSPSDPDSPLSAAVGWLMAYHGASWTDGTPAAWIDRIRPYVTDTLHASNETLRSGGGGIDWTDFVRQQCTSTVTDTHAVIPPESRGTDTSANVQVTGTIHTTCTAGVPTRPTEPASATLVVVTTAHGWRIDHRLF